MHNKTNVFYRAAVTLAVLVLSACGAAGDDTASSAGDEPRTGGDGYTGEDGHSGGDGHNGGDPQTGGDAYSEPWGAADSSSYDDTAPAPPWEAEQPEPQDGSATPEATEPWAENDWINTEDDNLATFSVDVDTASYTRTRSFLLQDQLPEPTDVRVEEFLNYFNYGYEPPDALAPEPFAVHFEGGPSAFGEGLHMLRAGIQGRIIDPENRPAANLVFLIDASGSMNAPLALPLVKESLRLLTASLSEDDWISVIVYAGDAGVVLEPTPGDQHDVIIEAIESIGAGGSTAGEAGIRLAYQYAQANLMADGINRVILCTDGDFNVGMTGEELIQFAESQRDSGVTLTGLLFNAWGDDAFMEQLANRADGNYFSINERPEALRILGRELLGTLLVIAKDVKIQAMLNRDVVARYRIVGYDNRLLEDNEFNDDTVDAAEIGAGHDVTALLEVELRDTTGMAPEALVAWVQLRYKLPYGDESILVEYPLQLQDLRPDAASMSPSLQQAIAVAEFAEILRRSRHSEGARFEDIAALLSPQADDEDVADLLSLVERASALWNE
jgi:Ca-activated chloride channel family protein